MTNLKNLKHITMASPSKPIPKAAMLAGSGTARLFELDLGGEATAITPNRQNRQLPAAMPVGHGAVLRFEPAVDLDPVPLPGMADIGEQQVVLLSPEEWDSVEALVRPEHVAGCRLTLAFGDDPVLDADAFTGQQVGPPGDVAGSVDARKAGLEVLTHHDAAVDR